MPVRDGTWTTSEIELINEKVSQKSALYQSRILTT